jgi:hypothetical protein
VKLRAFLIALMAAGGVALPAQATEWLYCRDESSTVTIGLLLGAMDVLAVAGITLSHDDTVWASDAAYGPGEPIAVGQGFEDATRLDVDFVDSAFSLLAQLRLSKASEGDQFAYGGTLRIVGRGAWAVSCPAE